MKAISSPRTTGPRRSVTPRLRRIGATALLALTATSITIWGSGTATAATTHELAATIETGLNQKADDVILSGDSTWSIPTSQGPEQKAFLPAFATSLHNPDYAPPGANDFSCKPAAGHNPVVLVHGTWENAYNNWAYLSPMLKRFGYCVYTLNYGKIDIRSGGGLGALVPGANGTGDIAQSSGQLSQFVDKVLTSTGTAKVDIVGHSQGGVLARNYLKFDGGATKVQRLISLGATNHGTTLLGIGALGRAINNAGIDILGPVGLGVGVSGIQQVIDSQFLTGLNSGGDTVPGVNYTSIATKYDEITTPYDSAFLTAGPGATVKNITLQDGCRSDLSDHLSMNYSFRSATIVLNALGATWHGVPVPVLCMPNAWLLG